MPLVKRAKLPSFSLLRSYEETQGVYTDCFKVEHSGLVEIEQLIIAFYNTPLFKMERVILHYLLKRSSTDIQVRQLAEGKIDKFAAWTLERRTIDQILLCDFSGRTRSWLMVEKENNDPSPKTLLYFGSAVLPAPGTKNEKPSLDLRFSALLGLHRFYSRALLWSAHRKLVRGLH